MKSPKLIYRLF